MKIIVGLGNPGNKYQKNRHNIGFIILDKIVETKNLTWEANKRFHAHICKDGDIIYIKPLTFMNNSGQAVQAVMSYYKLLPKTLGLITKKNCSLSDVLTVIHDDVDIDFGKYKTTESSRAAGHNGVRSIINHLKTQNFKRIRIGIRTEELKRIPTENFVLQNFTTDEINILKNIMSEIPLFK